ncbi:protein of unknown function DUF3626 [Yasminevirus sp. GU-2018]|uniref:Uncharacterized protein n=1 Tax=Yasminevirus sp. GU-2018 TaxID=2420051 RepID=A0A5K0UC76_9VIRU|nr:protein of unknown function DUF3626 [Yasminevirus sp. GU-2018]
MTTNDIGLLVACDKCDKLVMSEKYIDHDKRCSGKQIRQTQQTENTQTKSKKVLKVEKTEKTERRLIGNSQPNPYLNDIQQKAVDYCFKKARIYHKNVYPNAVIRFIELGLTEQDLTDTLEYIKDLDAIIHFGGPTKTGWIRTENRVKNAYEVNRESSYLVSRTDWENNLFNKICGDDTDDLSRSNRVKYGCLNMLSDPAGCISARSYGPSYMILRKELKNRITFVCGDSAGKQQHMCTFDNCVQLLLYMDENLLKNVVALAKFKQTKIVVDNVIKEINNHRNYSYIEIQVHGDVFISRDIERVVLDKNSMSKEEMHEVVSRLKHDNIPYTINDYGPNVYSVSGPFRPTFL